MTDTFPADRLIAISAFRYALGRRSYIVDHVAEWLIAQGDALPPFDRNLIVREIDEAEARDGLGMACDVASWHRVRTALSAERGASP